MKSRAKMLLGVAAAVATIGCTGSTAVSNQPSQTEIQEGVNRRLAAIDQQPGLTPEAKERMKQQVRGSLPDSNRK